MPIPPTLIISALFAWLDAGIYAYIAWRLRQRIVSSQEARLAWQLFIVWWAGLAATTLVSGLLNTLGAFDLISMPLFIAMTYINILVICAALWGLLYYLMYLFTGNSRSLVPLTVFYVVYYALLVYYITARVPYDVTVGRWSTALAYRTQITGPLFVLLLILLVVPQIIAGLAYFTLYFRVRDVTQKYRILLVSWSIVVWFGSALVGSFAGLSQFDWWQITNRLIGLAATLTILMAYIPPRWVKQRYGIASLGETERG
jgi:hypothetical protein